MGVTVDEELDRLYVSGFWGVDVIDLRSKKVIDSVRTGLLARFAVIDKMRNLIFVTTTVEGKIRILDRHTLRILKTIPIGCGPRAPFISEDMSSLYASSDVAHYRWDINRLMGGFNREDSCPAIGYQLRFVL